MSVMFEKLVFASMVVVASMKVVVGSTTVYAEADIDFGIDVQAERSHQEFEDDSANVTTVDIAPYFQYGNWDFSLDAPWISADANYVNNQLPARVVAACDDPSAAVAEKYPNLGPQAVAKLAARVTAYCQNSGVVSSDDTVSGMSDITAYAHYGILLDAQSIWLLSLGLGYKFDNGDADKNLGSDTRNTLLEVGLGANYGKLNASLSGGVVFVNGGDEFTESSYNYASLDMGISPAGWVTLGCSVDYDQSYYEFSDDVTTTTAYLKFKPWQHVRLKVYARDFGSAEGYPDREYGGSVSLVY